jgi:hypothetical protein
VKSLPALPSVIVFAPALTVVVPATLRGPDCDTAPPLLGGDDRGRRTGSQIQGAGARDRERAGGERAEGQRAAVVDLRSCRR